MTFWQSDWQSATCPIDLLLEKDTVSLDELLEEPELLSELKAQNSKLLNLLVAPPSHQPPRLLTFNTV